MRRDVSVTSRRKIRASGRKTSKRNPWHDMRLSNRCQQRCAGATRGRAGTSNLNANSQPTCSQRAADAPNILIELIQVNLMTTFAKPTTIREGDASFVLIRHSDMSTSAESRMFAPRLVQREPAPWTRLWARLWTRWTRLWARQWARQADDDSICLILAYRLLHMSRPFSVNLLLVGSKTKTTGIWHPGTISEYPRKFAST